MQYVMVHCSIATTSWPAMATDRSDHLSVVVVGHRPVAIAGWPTVTIKHHPVVQLASWLDVVPLSWFLCHFEPSLGL